MIGRFFSALGEGVVFTGATMALGVLVIVVAEVLHGGTAP